MVLIQVLDVFTAEYLVKSCERLHGVVLS